MSVKALCRPIISTIASKLIPSACNAVRPLSTSLVAPQLAAAVPQPTSNIEIQVMKDKNVEWRTILEPWLQFFVHEPLNSAVKGFRTESGKKSLEGLLKDVMTFDDTPCVVAWDTEKDQAAGFMINQTFYRDPTPEQAKPPIPFGNHSWDEDSLQTIMDIGGLLQSLSEGNKIFTALGINKIWKMQVASVSQEYTKQGLLGRLFDQCVIEAQKSNAGHDALVMECTSLYTYKACQRRNFQLTLESDYSEHYSNFTKMVDNTTHQKVRVMTQMLKND